MIFQGSEEVRSLVLAANTRAWLARIFPAFVLQKLEHFRRSTYSKIWLSFKCGRIPRGKAVSPTKALTILSDLRRLTKDIESNNFRKVLQNFIITNMVFMLFLIADICLLITHYTILCHHTTTLIGEGSLFSDCSRIAPSLCWCDSVLTALLSEIQQHR